MIKKIITLILLNVSTILCIQATGKEQQKPLMMPSPKPDSSITTPRTTTQNYSIPPLEPLDHSIFEENDNDDMLLAIRNTLRIMRYSNWKIIQENNPQFLSFL